MKGGLVMTVFKHSPTPWQFRGHTLRDVNDKIIARFQPNVNLADVVLLMSAPDLIKNLVDCISILELSGLGKKFATREARTLIQGILSGIEED
jgi:hypothetical protein